MKQTTSLSVPFKVVVTGLTVDEARVVEQALISAYGKENLENKYRSITPAKVTEVVGRIDVSSIDLFEGFLEDEIINFLEGNF